MSAFDPTNPTQVEYVRKCVDDPWPYDWAEVAKALGCEPTKEAVRAALDELIAPRTCGMADEPHIGGRVCKHGEVVAAGGVCAREREFAELGEERGQEWSE